LIAAPMAQVEALRLPVALSIAVAQGKPIRRPFAMRRTALQPLARYGAREGALRERLATDELHHHGVYGQK
jgi:hypothetical protein